MWSQNEQQFEFLDILAIIGFVVQMMNYEQNSKQSSNDDLMREMRTQDRVYLQKIVEQNEKIIKMLESKGL